MCFREHVFDLFARPDIPVRHIVCQHLLFPLRFQSFPLSHALHDREGLLAVQPFSDQISHDVISCTDCRGNGCLAFFDQGLCISKPYVCSMGQTGNADQIWKALRFGIHKHLDNEIGSKLRNTKRTERTSSKLLRCNAKCLRADKKRHDFFIVQRNVLCIDVC